MVAVIRPKLREGPSSSFSLTPLDADIPRAWRDRHEPMGRDGELARTRGHPAGKLHMAGSKRRRIHRRSTLRPPPCRLRKSPSAEASTARRVPPRNRCHPFGYLPATKTRAPAHRPRRGLRAARPRRQACRSLVAALTVVRREASRDREVPRSFGPPRTPRRRAGRPRIPASAGPQ